MTLTGTRSRAYAERHQTEVTNADRILTARAQVRHGAVRHWWGWRQWVKPAGAWCYLCERIIAPYAAGRPATSRSVELIMAHRADHLREGAEPLPPPTTGTGAPIDDYRS